MQLLCTGHTHIMKVCCTDLYIGTKKLACLVSGAVFKLGKFTIDN